MDIYRKSFKALNMPEKSKKHFFFQNMHNLNLNLSRRLRHGLLPAKLFVMSHCVPLLQRSVVAKRILQYFIVDNSSPEGKGVQ